MRVYNFSAGPGVLPVPVLEEVLLRLQPPRVRPVLRNRVLPRGGPRAVVLQRNRLARHHNNNAIVLIVRPVPALCRVRDGRVRREPLLDRVPQRGRLDLIVR